MPSIKVYNNGYILDEDRVKLFIGRIDSLILQLQREDLDSSELSELKEKIQKDKMYKNTEEWYLNSVEDTLRKHITNEEDLPF